MDSPQELNILTYIFIAAALTFGIRLAPFVIFRGGRKVPSIVTYIGKYLPPAIITGIVIYCLKGIDFTAFPYGAKEISAAMLVIFLHLWKRNMLISVFAGTLYYMMIVQYF